MIYIVAGTNRPGSNSAEVAKILHGYYKDLGVQTEVMDLAQLPMQELDGSQYSENKPKGIQLAVDKITQAKGVVFVVPEYNGSYPGILKYFIDHFSYPETFEGRKVAFVGIGGRFGGMRPVEHLQGVFGYRNAYMYPVRVFISNVWDVVKEGQIHEDKIEDCLKKQCQGFIQFIKTLEN